MDELLKKAEVNMRKSLQVLIDEYAAIKAGRANPALIDKISIDYYGTQTPINQLAAISVTEARTLTIQPWEVSLCSAVEKAIQVSDLGINPQSDGKIIRVTFPPLTEDRRREIVKEIAAMAEDARIAVRSIRRDVMDKLRKMKKDGLLAEDQLKRGEKRVQDFTDLYCKEIGDISSKKEKEIMSL
jgi:ribosome recycling factor